jgi:hypothetical protein
MQDAIYNQIQVAQNLANAPFQPYSLPTVADLSPLQQQAYRSIEQNQGAWQSPFQKAQTGLEGLSTAPGSVGAASPYLGQQAAALAGVDTGAGARTLSPFVQASLAGSGLTAAAPYMQQAAQTSAQDIGQFMNPYTESVTNQIAKLGARNLSENLLPGVSDSFIRAGQFGGTRMGEFGARALRDTQESILGQQSQALQAGYGQALSAAQQDAARQAQLASTAGGLGTAQQQAILSGGQALSSAQQQAIQQEMARAQGLGQVGTQLGQLTNEDLKQRQSALQQMAQMAQQGQQMQTADVAALEAAGSSQRSVAQQQLDAARAQYEAQRLYPQQQMDWLSTQIRGMAPITPQTNVSAGQSSGQNYAASPLQQLATGLYAYKGLSSI